jgi:hypothetical protein
MILLDALFQSTDVFIGPLCFVLLLMVFSVVVRKYKDEKMKKLLLKAFYFKMFCTVAYTFLNSYYYRGGDTEMYYQCAQFLKDAVMDDTDNFVKIYMTKMINVKTELMNYFIYNDSPYPVFEAMHDPGNFMVPKLALPFILLFNDSYLCTAMFFSFFALGGSIRLYKFFLHYFPQYQRELALACLFLPSVGFWSSGVLKDPVCFGCVGYIVYGMFNIFVKRKKIIASLVWITICSVLLFYIKIYILLALSPGIVLWLFGEFNKVVENKTLRNIMAMITFVVGGILALVLVNYVTSDESAKAFKLDALVETSTQNRLVYEDIGQKYEGSYFTIQTSNPVLLILNGIAAALFRPFLWEINGITAFMSAMEALFFLYLTVMVMYKRGPLNFFRNAFKQPVLLMCFVFALVFSAAVGSTALNFGSLSRYKIPCLPFYLTMVLILYRQGGLTYPDWLKKLLGYNKPAIQRPKSAF